MAQRNTVQWYPVKLDGRAMYLTRDSGVVEYVAHSGEICAKDASDV